MKRVPSAASGERDPAAPLAIAVADDLADMLVLLREWLSAAGHDVTCVANGRDLVRTVCAGRFDLVITDVMMPEADGLEAIRELRRACPNVRIVAISGGGTIMSSSGYLNVAKLLGADEILLKPFTREKLIAAVARAVEPRRADMMHAAGSRPSAVRLG